MNKESIKIYRIQNKLTVKENNDCYAVCWITNDVIGISINEQLYENSSNSIYFLNPEINWNITKESDTTASGYILYIPKHILNHPSFKSLHINEVRFFSDDEIPNFNLSPGIETRIQSIFEMIDELTSTQLNNREDAVLALLNVFFIYCDGKCNIKSNIKNRNAKTVLVYNFKRHIIQYLKYQHKVGYYANILNVSDNYLNECVKEVLGVNAKQLIKEQLLISSRHNLKFTDKSIKEVGYELGFSSPDYFSYFLKKHTGLSPSQIRNH